MAILLSLLTCLVWLASAERQNEPTALLQHSVHGGESKLDVTSDGKRAKYQVIVDTDMDTDDQMAIAYLLAQPDIEVLAILVGCNGWSQQWQGVMSVMRLTKYFGKADLPVAFSPRYNGDTQLNLEEIQGRMLLGLFQKSSIFKAFCISSMITLYTYQSPCVWL